MNFFAQRSLNTATNPNIQRLCTAYTFQRGSNHNIDLQSARCSSWGYCNKFSSTARPSSHGKRVDYFCKQWVTHQAEVNATEYMNAACLRYEDDPERMRATDKCLESGICEKWVTQPSNLGPGTELYCDQWDQSARRRSLDWVA